MIFSELETNGKDYVQKITIKTFFTETKDLKMRIAAAFILLISLAMAFKLEKEHPVFEDDPHEQYSPDELDEPDEQYEPDEQDEPAELYELDEPEERIEQEEDEDGNKVIEQFDAPLPRQT